MATGERSRRTPARGPRTPEDIWAAMERLRRDTRRHKLALRALAYEAETVPAAIGGPHGDLFRAAEKRHRQAWIANDAEMAYLARQYWGVDPTPPHGSEMDEREGEGAA